MDTNKPPGSSPADSDEDIDSLETLETPETNVIDATGGAKLGGGAPAQPYKLPKKTFRDRIARFNLYLLLFVFIILIAVGVTVITYFASKKAAQTTTISSQTLDKKALDQLANTDATVGDPKQVLSVQSNAVFAGKVLVRDTLEVAGGIQVSGPVTLSGLTVTGKTNLSDVQVSKNLAIAGDTAVQGGLTIQKSLQVNGGGTFSGPLSAPQITVSTLQLNGDLVLTHHITAGGPTPNRTNGPSLGSGGSASVSGSDTSGTVTINTGSGAPAGCFANINFAQKFNSVPHVTITPVGADGGAIDYYVTRTTSGFSICDSTAPPAGASFAFDYFVVD
ncbi:MAG: hypothetical protein QFB87_01575 [Patescibacteria group bacterium]|nr:hypothetical protein [Patescibacteria group bacterium]